GLLEEFGHMLCLEFVQMHGVNLWRWGRWGLVHNKRGEGSGPVPDQSGKGRGFQRLAGWAALKEL
ncbi:MAG: hypothetical protein RL559_1208, partial [Pseudomonadota bacterium]